MAKKWPKIFIIATLILCGFFIGFSAWTQVSLSWVGNVFNGFWQSNAALPPVPTGPEPLPPEISILSPQNDMIFYTATPTSTTSIISFHLSAYTDPGKEITTVTLYNRTAGGNLIPAVQTVQPVPPGCVLPAQIYDCNLTWGSTTCVSSKCAGTLQACTQDSDCRPGIGDYTVFAEAIDNNVPSLKSDSPDLILHVATQPTLEVKTYDLTTGNQRTIFPPNSNIKVKVTVEHPALFQTMDLFWAEAVTSPATPIWFNVTAGHWVNPDITGTLTNVMLSGSAEKDYLLKVVGTTLAPLSQIIESDPPFTFTLVKEICDNAEDEDKDGNIDNGCLQINFNIANIDAAPPYLDNYWVYIKAAADTEYTILSVDDDPNFMTTIPNPSDRTHLGAVHGAKSFDYLVQPGEYDVKVVFNTSHLAPATGGWTYFYSTSLNVIISGGPGSIVSVPYGNGAGAFEIYPTCTINYCPNPNVCVQNSANFYTCTFKSTMCNVYVAAGLYGTSCSPSNTGDEQITGPGRGIFEIHVQSGVQSPTIIRGVAITSPADNITVGAFTSYIGIAASAFSLNPVTKVEFYQQKSTAATPTLLFTDNSAPYSYIWASPTVGTYELTAKAYDSQGNFTSDPVTVIRQ